MLNLGVDVGTTAVKAAAFDQDGNNVVFASQGTETISLKPGWAEQDMEEVWSAVKKVIRSVLEAVDADEVASIGVAGQGDGLWALDAKHKPVRNAILWNDQRASDIIEAWLKNGISEALAVTCRTAMWPGTSAAAYVWLKDNEPENSSKIAHVCNAKDWIGFCLTGKLATDFTDASIPFLDLQSHTYSKEAFEICGAAELSTKVALPQLSADLLGEVAVSVAEETGLSPTTRVAVGSLDLAAMHIGSGFNEIGQSLLILGTTAVVSTVVEPSPPGGEVVGATVFHPKGDRWLNAQAPQSGASAVDWLASLHPETWPGGAEDVMRSAEQAPAGANGALFLPYLTGERAPFVAPRATGSFLGLRATTTMSDLARAVLEGVAFSLRHCVDTTGIEQSYGFAITGGGAKSEFWRQILADVLDSPVSSSAEDEYGIRGAALLGAAAAGHCDPYSSSTAKDGTETHSPNENLKPKYDSSYAKFRASIDALNPTW